MSWQFSLCLCALGLIAVCAAILWAEARAKRRKIFIAYRDILRECITPRFVNVDFKTKDKK